MTFDVNGFSVDKRQVSPEGVDADPLGADAAARVLAGHLLGLGRHRRSRRPAASPCSPTARSPTVPVEMQALRDRRSSSRSCRSAVEEFLTVVRDPGGAPAHRVPVRLRRAGSHRLAARVVDRRSSRPSRSCPTARAGASRPPRRVAHIEVDIRSLFDGSVRHVTEDVPFVVTATIAVLPDGSASITVGGPDTRLTDAAARLASRARRAVDPPLHVGDAIRDDVERRSEMTPRDRPMAARRRRGAAVQAGLAVAGRPRRHRRDGAAHPRGHGLRGRGRAAARDGPVRHDRAPARVRGVRSVPHPRARARTRRSRPSSPHRSCRSRSATTSARSRSRVCSRSWSACSAARRHPAARVRHRSAVEADPRRLPQRGRAARDHLADPEAPRLLDRRGRRSGRTSRAIVQGIAVGDVQPLAVAFGVGSLDRDLRAQAGSARRCRACWSWSCSPRRSPRSSGSSGRLPVVGALPQGLPAPALGGLEWADVAALAAARRRHRARRLHRQRRALAHLRRAPRRERRRQPGDGGHRPREHRGRLPRRVPGVGVVVAHARRRAGRLPHAAHRRRRAPRSSSPSSCSRPGLTAYLPSRRSPRSSSARRSASSTCGASAALCAWTRWMRRSRSPRSSACSSFGVLRASS